MKRNKLIILFCLVLSSHPTLLAQSVGIGKSDFDPESAAILELRSDNQGLLIPRLTSNQKEAIQNPPLGLLVFQTDEPVGFHFYTKTGWTYLVDRNLSTNVNFQQLNFDKNTGVLSLENGGSVDLSQYLSGRKILSGTSAPDSNEGSDGDFYFNTDTKEFYGPKTAGAWGTATSLIGPQGLQGPAGADGIDGVDGLDGKTILNGNSDPTSSDGVDGDFFLNTSTYNLFGPKTAGAWGTATSLIGPQGLQGPAGADGVDGTNGVDGSDGIDGVDGLNGKTILNGTADPTSSDGVDGDFFLNTSTYDLFGPKTAGAWGTATSLIGPQGLQGPAGADGVDGTNGVDGADGVDGLDGKTILNGTVDPTSTDGVDGDFYLNTSTYNLFGPKTAGIWGSATSLVGPQGLQGPAGADGADGIDGTNGIDGADGTNGIDGVDGLDGKTILNGTADPTSSDGVDGDFFLNTSTYDLFGPKTAGAWGAATSLIGPQGLQGPSGADGVDGTNGIDGVDGLNGKTILNGTSDPTSSDGVDGDFFLNTSTYDLFGPKTAGAWGAATSLIGPQGIQGPAGADGVDGTNGVDGADGTNGIDGVDGLDGKTILNGTSNPTSAEGVDGDFFLNTSTYNLFGPKTAGAWGAATSLIGPQGLQGPAGADGIDGIDGVDGLDGKTILNGTSDPTSSDGVDGDFFLNTSTYDLFGPKTAGIWGAATSLIGPQGLQGPAGADGIDGIDGVDGLDGKTILNGTSDPTSSDGVDGDFFLNTSTYDLFGPKTAGIWGAATSLIGPQGLQGPAGADGVDGTNGVDGADGTNGIDGVDGLDGKTILNGTSNPTSAEGVDGDFFLNTSTYNLFGPKTAGAWGAATSLIGPQGLQGPAGADGVDGTNGVDGADGTNGIDGVDGLDGKTILNGTSNPTSADGVDGDFYLNTSTYDLFGPKTAGIWGSAASLVGPQGLQGPAGADGADGIDGTNGIDGADGTNGIDGVDGLDGKTILNGTSDPTSADGVDGDFFLNTSTYDLFGPKTAGAWGSATSLVGPQGPAGADGTDGTNGVDGADGIDGVNGLDGKTILNGTSDPTSADGVDGDFFLNTSTYDLFGPKTAGAWGAATSLIGPQGLQGPAGADGIDGIDGVDGLDGKTILNGTSDPTSSDGVDGDFFLNTSTYDLFGPKTAGIWGAATSLIGPQGLQGPAGADGTDGVDGTNGVDGADGTNGIDGVDGLDGKTILNGTSDPTSSDGVDGDFFLNTSTYDLFGPKTAGAWGAATSLIGPQGLQGPAGADGADGIDGANGADGADGIDGVDGLDGKTILNGTSNPTSSDGVDGDFFLNTSTYDLFGPKTGGAWGTATSLIGPQGLQGPAGADGTDGTNGVDGADGIDGLDGKTILNGTSNPTSSDGVDGDFFLNTSTYNLFGPKTAGAWGTATSLIGPQGLQGPAGADGVDGTNGTNGADGIDGVNGLNGKTILNGTSNPTSSDGVDGDFFLNTSTYNLFGPKTAGAWGAATSLIGPQGLQGPAGADGVDGTNGTNGADGVDGIDGADGRTILSGSSDPSSGTGNDGDLYINTSTLDFFGPKTSGNWGVGISIQGNGINIHDSDNDTWVSTDLSASDDDIIRFQTAGSEVVRFESDKSYFSQSVGIGIENPSYALHVNGTVRASWFSLSSDQRFKTNIAPISSALDKVLRLQGVNYNWNISKFPNMNFDQGLQVGFIAQDFEKVIPELVSKDSDGYLGINYAQLAPVLVEAIKEQQSKIESLNKEVSDLKQKVELLIKAIEKGGNKDE